MKIKLLIIVLFLFNCGMGLAQHASKAQHKPVKFKKLPKQNGAVRAAYMMDLDNFESYFSYIPKGSYRMNDGKMVTCNAFYMMRVEVPNVFYRLFINDLKLEGKTEDVKIALPDTNAWAAWNEPFAEYYFSHPAFNMYPVLQVQRAGVILFCNWLSEKVKTLNLKAWKDKKVQFRLPTEAEWMLAATGGDTNAVYAWAGPYLRTGRKGFEGDYQANFYNISESRITRDANGDLVVDKINYTVMDLLDIQGSDWADITAPVASYWPNNYGLYNMCGNAREMVEEEGFSKGGGWIDPGGDLLIDARNTVQKPGCPAEGFRIIAVVE
jgi:formylglycine-generating enzyme required for sulfatase activity